MTDFGDIQKAYQRIKAYVHKTPIISSSLLNRYLGHEIYFKAECFQKVGAFKARGGCHAVAHLIEQKLKPKRIVANSSGNHAQAVAWAAAQFSIPATIFMPANVSTVKAQATRAYGASVELRSTRLEIDAAVKEAAEESGVYWIPPYNYSDVIAGQGTVAFEALQELDNVDAVFAPCGGGGLLSGTLISTRHLSPQTKVIGVEPLEANDAAESLRTGSIQQLKETPDTIADGARTPCVGELTFEFLKQLDEFYEADETAIKYWTQWLTHLLKITVEPTSAMAMFGVCQWLKQQKTRQKVLVILSGGNLDQSTRQTIWQEDRLINIPTLFE